MNDKLGQIKLPTVGPSVTALDLFGPGNFTWSINKEGYISHRHCLVKL